MGIQISLASLVVLMAASAFGQSLGVSQRGNSVVQGQVYLENAGIGTMTLELNVPSGSGGVGIPLQPDGSFELRGLASGRYDLTIVGPGGQVVHQESVVIFDGYQRLSVSARDAAAAAAPKPAGTVSVRQLQHKIPNQARTEQEKGLAAMKKGDGFKALDHFAKAKLIDPQFAEAYNNSGAAYVDLGQLQDAAAQFQKAVDLVPDYPDALANLSIVLCRMQHYQEASDTARRALKLNSGLLKMRYILGLSLTMAGGDKMEALKNAGIASAEIPQAYLLAGKILEDTGQRQEAAKQLDAYLHSAPADSPDRKTVEEWLAELQH